MDKAKEMLLADAIETAIKATKKNILMRRIIVALSLLCSGLIISHIVR